MAYLFIKNIFNSVNKNGLTDCREMDFFIYFFFYLGPLRTTELKVSWVRDKADSRERASQKGENWETATVFRKAGH